MTKRYTLTECYELLQVDPKTFRRWIEKAKIEPQVSKADDRVKYLTQAQLEELAALHERMLPQALPQHEATLNPGTYKLLVDQMEELQNEVETAFSQTHEAWRTIDAVRESYEGELATLRTTVEEKGQALQQLTDLQRQQHEDLATLIGNQQQALDLQKAHQAEQHSRQEIRLDELSHTWEQFQQDIQTRLGTLSTTFDEHRLALTTQIGELRDHVQRLETEMPQRIEAAKTLVQAQIAEMSSRTGTIAEQVSSFSTAQSGVQHQVETLTRALKTETEQRQALADQVTQLAEELRRLKRPALKSPRRRKTAASSETEAGTQ